MGAIPIAIAVSDAAYRAGERKLPAFVVRKERKGHGLKKTIEGMEPDGQRVLIVDDVVTSGKSTIEAIRRCREKGLKVESVVCLVDRDEMGGRKAIEDEGVVFSSLYTLLDLTRASK
ncbi:MAG: phosphoribosyltransferase family protein [Rubricoccaceae bacterium]|nr:phosphoribosyltransferase family protein [Rubricoccaceae bacterium]